MSLAWMSVALPFALVCTLLTGHVLLDGYCIEQLSVSHAQGPCRIYRTGCCSGASTISLQASRLALTPRVAHGG